MKRPRILILFFLALATGVCSWAEPVSLVSVRDNSQPASDTGNGDSYSPILTPDGRYVLFASTADNLVRIGGSHSLPYHVAQSLNVFRRDRYRGQTVLISVNAAGTGGGNDDSLPTAISADGRYVLFESGASDLLPDVTNGMAQVYWRDVWSNSTVLVSVSTNGSAANGVSRGSTFTPDGCHVAFTGEASNLVPHDTNGIADVFVRDLQTGVTTLASVGAKASAIYMPVASESPELSADDRYVAFYSTATNLVSGVTNIGEIYIRDLVNGSTILASAGAHDQFGPTAVSFNHSLSADGSFLAYEACPAAPASTGDCAGVILRFNLASGQTDVVNTNAYASPANVEEFHDLSLTPEGREIAFIGNAGSNTTCVLLWDARSGQTTLVSGDLSGNVPTNTVCSWPAVDPSGRYVAFLSNAQGLVTNSLRGDSHLYLTDLQTGRIRLLDSDSQGVGVGVNPLTAPQLCAEKKLVAFESDLPGLVRNDRNHDLDVFVRDWSEHETELISARNWSLPSLSPNGISSLGPHASSTDGQRVVFSSEADNLVRGVSNGFRNILVHDRQTGQNFLADVSDNGGDADGISSEPAISGDGNSVVFSSYADNLAAGDTNGVQDVFVHNLITGTTELVSVSTNGFGSGDSQSRLPAISSDGRYVFFLSFARNLAPGNFSGLAENLFMRDLDANKTYALTTIGTGNNSLGIPPYYAITLDGRWVAYLQQIGQAKLYIWDAQTAANSWTQTVSSASVPISLSPDLSKIVLLYPNVGLNVLDRATGAISPINSLGHYPTTSFGLKFSADGSFLTYSAGINSITAPVQVYYYDFQSQTEHLVSTAAGSSQGADASPIHRTSVLTVVLLPIAVSPPTLSQAAKLTAPRICICMTD